MVTRQFNTAEYIENCRSDSPVAYSAKDSGTAFIHFYKQMGYSDKSVKTIERCVKRTHQQYPSIAWLNKAIAEGGFISVGKKITPNSAHGTSYLHFLVIVGLAEMSFYDYFSINPKMLAKLNNWFDSSKERLGIIEFVDEMEVVANSSENRDINQDKVGAKATRAALYLVLRYRLGCVRDITVEQWQDFVLECREHSRKTASGVAVNLAPVRLMHTAFFNMGVLENPYTREFGGVKSIEKDRPWLEAPGYGEYATEFLEYIRRQKEKGTKEQYVAGLELFYRFLADRHGGEVDITKLLRADARDFVAFLLKTQADKGWTFNWVESRALCVKTFLTFVSGHAVEFKSRGLEIFKSNVVVAKDFRTPHIKRGPRGISESVRDALICALRFVPSDHYQLAFKLMFHTGLAPGDMLALKDNCLLLDEVRGNYLLTAWRRKVKKRGQFKVKSVVVKIVAKLKEMNTQQVPTDHPDGTKAIFLFNDGGSPCGDSWLRYWFDRHKGLAAEASPELAEEISKITPHQLRHTFAEMLREKGASIFLIKELMLHDSLNTTFGYTKESDKNKVDLVQRLEDGEYVCDEYPSLSQAYLNSEEGRAFVDKLVKHENKFSYGRCTVNGSENCPKAYRCLSCEYLCSTEDDVPEILGAITVQRIRIETYTDKIVQEFIPENKASLEMELGKSKARLTRLLQKLRKIQAKQRELPEGYNDLDTRPNEADSGDIIEFF